MPYIVTTAEGREQYERRRSADPEAYRNQSVSRRAVATLDEAREIVVAAYAEQGRAAPRPGWNDPLGSCESPRHFGPLPDGTTIKVEQASEHALLSALRHVTHCPTCGIQRLHVNGQDLIDAYNAAQSAEPYPRTPVRR